MSCTPVMQYHILVNNDCSSLVYHIVVLHSD
jgi:hypothetical protein